MSFTTRAVSLGELNGGQGAAEVSSDLERCKSSRSLEKKKSFRFRSKNRDESKKLGRSSSMKSLSHLFHKIVSTVQLPVKDTKSFSTVSSSNKEVDVEGSSYKTRDENDNKPSYKPREVLSLTGLKNHGNTCFMNAIIQCLAHTDLLAEYFVLGNYKQDINARKGQSKTFGTHGEVTEKLAILLQNLWSSQYNSQISSEFKTVVGQHGLQYRGYAQHDAQEFLLWLLDKVHEDLNRATKRKYKQNKDNIGRSDEVIANESLSNHMRCNDSIVLDLFQAQYRSSLVCPECKQQSTTFEPFLCLSLPIPQRNMRPLYVTVVFVESSSTPLRIGVSVPVYSKIADLSSAVSEMTAIPVDRLLITNLGRDGFQGHFKDHQSISIIHEGDNIYAFEVPKELYPDPKSVGDTSLVIAGDDGGPIQDSLVILIANYVVQRKDCKRFGPPFILRVLRDVNFEKLHSMLLHVMSRMLQDNVSEVASKSSSLFALRVIDGISDKPFLSSKVVEHPLYQATVDRALDTSDSCKVAQYIRINVEWDDEMKTRFIKADVNDYPEEHSSVREMETKFQTAHGVGLNDCFSLYTREEQLGEDDAWLCPKCKKAQQGTKRLSLWSLPEVLVVHLKRFRQTPTGRTKLNTFVNFPTTDLDMTSHLEPRHKQQTDHHSLPSLTSWRRNRRNSTSSYEDNCYDLYAVCNHIGTMSGGHYTAFCKNPTDGQWYLYDDTRVEKMSSDQVVSSSAYLLFYVRHGPGSSSASECSGSLDHWTRKLPQKMGSSLGSSREELDDHECPPNKQMSSSVDALNAANKKENQKSMENMVLSETAL